MDNELYKSVALAVKKGDRRQLIPQLKKLHHHIKATNPATCELPVELVALLVQLIHSDDKKSWQAKHMCMKVLVDLLPQSVASLKLEGVPLDDTVLPYLLPLALIQSKCDPELQYEAVTQIVRWLSKPGSTTPVQSICLSVLMNMMQDQPALLNADNVNVVSSQLKTWLRDAERTQAPYKRLLRKAEAKQPLVTEMDGKPTKDFFTVLCVGRYYTPMQLLNVHSFSVLRSWLVHTAPHHISADSLPSSLSQNLSRLSFTVPDDNSSRDSKTEDSKGGSSSNSSENTSSNGSVPGTPSGNSTMYWTPGSVASQNSLPSPLQNRRYLSFDSSVSPQGSPRDTPSPSTPSSGRTSPSGWSLVSGRSSVFGLPPDVTIPAGAKLTETAFCYCMRILKQGSIKPQHKSDIAVQDAAIIEAVSTLDHLCQQNHSSSARVVEELHKLKERVHRHPRILLAVVKFLLHNGEDVKQDWTSVYEKFFKTVLNTQYRDPAIAYETVQFIVANLDTLCYDTNILSRFFPNLFKILAWDCENFKDDFLWILPAILSPTTAIEVIHMILDLPTITACLEVQYQYSQSPQSQSPVIEAFRNPTLKPLFVFLLRGEAGFGDTIDKLEKVHSVLTGDVLNQYRVQKMVEVVPQLLQLIFDEVLEEGSATVAAKLVPVLLERSTLLLGIPNYVQSINKLFCKYLLQLFRTHPSLAVEEFTNLHDFLSNSKNIVNSSEDFFTHVVSVVGEYLSVTRCERCTPELVTSMYETLEPLCYELTARHRSSSTAGKMSPRLVSVLMSSVAKLCSRCPDLVPRGILCLTKLGDVQPSASSIRTRATQLINLLKLPNVASIILSPDSSVLTGRSHRDCSSMPVLLRTTSHLLSTQPPGLQ